MPDETKKNILVITRWFPDDAHPVRFVFVQRMIEALTAGSGKYSYSVISPTPYFPHCLSKLIPSLGLKCGGPEHGISPFGYQIFRPQYFKLPYPFLSELEWFSYSKTVLNLIAGKNLKFDLIHTHGLYPDAYVAVKIGHELSIPVISHAHDSYIREHIFRKYEDKLGVVMKESHFIAAVSGFQNKILAELYPDYGKKIFTVYNGVDTAKFTLPDGHEQVRLNPCRLIYVGNLIKTKQVDVLIHAIKLIPGAIDVTLDIYGTGPELSTYKQLVANLNLQKIVSFKGIIDNDQLASILPAYSFLIQPSPYETFGIVLAEAMSCGVPVVCFKASATQEVVSSGTVGILAENNSAEGLAHAIITAAKREWNRMEIRNYAVKRFAIGKTVESIEKLYANALQ